MTIHKINPSTKALRWAALAALTIAATAAGQAQVFTQFSFSSTTSATTVGSMVQSSVFGSSLSSSYIGNDGFGPVLEAYPTAGSTSAALALSNDSYWSMTVTAVSGQSLDVGTLSYEVGKGGASDPRGYFIRSSVDSFASNIAGTQLPTGSAVAPALATVDLSGNAGYQGLSSVEFRFYGWSPNTGRSVDWRNVTLEASSVPEPSGYGVIAGLGLLGFALVQRRRQAAGR